MAVVQNGLLPEDRIRASIGDVKWPVFVTPWTMYVDINRNCWINLDATYSLSPHGTSNMQVLQLSDGFWKVWLPSGTTWTVGGPDEPVRKGLVLEIEE